MKSCNKTSTQIRMHPFYVNVILVMTTALALGFDIKMPLAETRAHNCHLVAMLMSAAFPSITMSHAQIFSIWHGNTS